MMSREYDNRPCWAIGLDDLPDDIRVNVERYLEVFPEYAQPEAARGECLQASVDFQDQYGPWQGVILRQLELMEWYVEGGIVLGPAVPDFYFRLLEGCEYSGHFAVIVDRRYLIDFTARQFSPDVPYPVVIEYGAPAVEESDVSSHRYDCDSAA